MAEQTTQSSILIRTFPVGPLQCNCTILADPETQQAIIVDPGGDAEKILQVLEELGVTTVTQVLHTHAHFDHFLAAGHIKEKTGAPLALHKEDKFLWDSLEDQCRLFGVYCHRMPPPDHWLEDEEDIPLHRVTGKCIHTPGHTPGSMSFLFEDLQFLIAGDTLFRGSIGRTDLWGGDYQQIEYSIKHKLYRLDEATTVVTGHGPSTTIGDEMRHNAFIRA